MQTLDLQTTCIVPSTVEIYARPGKYVRFRQGLVPLPQRRVWHTWRDCPGLERAERAHQSRAAHRGEHAPPTQTFFHDVSPHTDLSEEQLEHYRRRPCTLCALGPALTLAGRSANVIHDTGDPGPRGYNVATVLVSCLLHDYQGTCRSCTAMVNSAAALGQVAADTCDGRICFAMRLRDGGSMSGNVAIETVADMALGAPAAVLALADELGGTAVYRRYRVASLQHWNSQVVRVNVPHAAAILRNDR